MKRSDLLALGLEKDKVDEIMDLHKIDAELWKAQRQELTEQMAAQPKAKEEDGGEWKAKHDRLKSEFDTYKQTIESEKTTSAKKAALREHLKAAGAPSDELILEALESRFDLSKLEMDGNAIKGFDAILAPVKEAHAKYFGTVQTQGAQVATPPANTGGFGNEFTLPRQMNKHKITN